MLLWYPDFLYIIMYVYIIYKGNVNLVILQDFQSNNPKRKREEEEVNVSFAKI